MIVLTSMKELPEHCYDCPCSNKENGYCQADENERYSGDWRPFWCPLMKIVKKDEMNENNVYLR